eukprot:354782-Chlamydomonas_euryale.AAC.6
MTSASTNTSTGTTMASPHCRDQACGNSRSCSACASCPPPTLPTHVVAHALHAQAALPQPHQLTWSPMLCMRTRARRSFSSIAATFDASATDSASLLAISAKLGGSLRSFFSHMRHSDGTSVGLYMTYTEFQRTCAQAVRSEDGGELGRKGGRGVAGWRSRDMGRRGMCTSFSARQPQ